MDRNGEVLDQDQNQDQALRIGILQVDSVRPEFKNGHGDYPDMFRALLMAAAPGALVFRDYDVCAGELPQRVDEMDAWLITGSRDSVYDPLPWIPALADFVRSAHAARWPLIGICFGHQLVARALGGETAAADVGWAVGVHQSRLLRRPAWITGVAEGFALLSSHKDLVCALPAGAELLATNAVCPNAAFTIGDHTLCLQGHPEFSKPYARALMDFRRELLGEAVYQQGIASLEGPLDATRVGQWMLAFMVQARALAMEVET